MTMDLRMYANGSDCTTSFDLFDIWKYLFINLSMIAVLLVNCCRKKTERDSEKVPLPLPQVYSVREAGGLQPMDDDMTQVPDSRSQKSAQDGDSHRTTKTSEAQQDSNAYTEDALMRNLRGIVAERRKQLKLKTAEKERTKRERKGHSRPSATVLEPSQVTKITDGEKKKKGSLKATAKKNETVQEKGEHATATVDEAGAKREKNASSKDAAKAATAAKPPKKDRGSSEKTDDQRKTKADDDRKTKNAGNTTTTTSAKTRKKKKSGDGGLRTKTTTTSTKTREGKSKDATNKSADDSPRKRHAKKTEEQPQFPAGKAKNRLPSTCVEKSEETE